MTINQSKDFKVKNWGSKGPISHHYTNCFKIPKTFKILNKDKCGKQSKSSLWFVKLDIKMKLFKKIICLFKEKGKKAPPYIPTSTHTYKCLQILSCLKLWKKVESPSLYLLNKNSVLPLTMMVGN